MPSTNTFIATCKTGASKKSPIKAARVSWRMLPPVAAPSATTTTMVTSTSPSTASTPFRSCCAAIPHSTATGSRSTCRNEIESHWHRYSRYRHRQDGPGRGETPRPDGRVAKRWQLFFAERYAHAFWTGPSHQSRHRGNTMAERANRSSSHKDATPREGVTSGRARLQFILSFKGSCRHRHDSTGYKIRVRTTVLRECTTSVVP